MALPLEQASPDAMMRLVDRADLCNTGIYPVPIAAVCFWMPVFLPWRFRAAGVRGVGTANVNVCTADTLFLGLEGLSHSVLVVVEILIANMY